MRVNFYTNIQLFCFNLVTLCICQELIERGMLKILDTVINFVEINLFPFTQQLQYVRRSALTAFEHELYSFNTMNYLRRPFLFKLYNSLLFSEKLEQISVINTVLEPLISRQYSRALRGKMSIQVCIQLMGLLVVVEKKCNKQYIIVDISYRATT